MGFSILNTVAITANDVFTVYGYTNMEVCVCVCVCVFCAFVLF